MKAVFDTECGVFEVELALDRAPVTAGYFRDIIKAGAFDGAGFFRIVGEDNASLRADNPIQVVQGGLTDTDPQPVGPIRHEPTSESGLRHQKWALSTARNGPGETYGSFFICMRNEPALDFGGDAGAYDHDAGAGGDELLDFAFGDGAAADDDCAAS